MLNETNQQGARTLGGPEHNALKAKIEREQLRKTKAMRRNAQLAGEITSNEHLIASFAFYRGTMKPGEWIRLEHSERAKNGNGT